ncbi:MAG TPA: hypothetical protein VMJ10_03535 [Kofleriaceae bacterium]|nr:hypothetical protein [Kofleriaceae bacterium]
MRRLALLAVLSGCPPKGASTPQQQIPEGGPCAAAAGVFAASYVTSEGGSNGHVGWVLPLHAMAVEPTAQVAEWAPLDATTAGVSGVPPPPQGPLWLVTANAPPCPAKAGGYYAAKLPGPPANVSYGVELTGCPPPSDPQESSGLVLATTDAPTGCAFEQPRPVSARLGDVDAQKQWHRPTKETPIPPALAGLVPVHDCKPPTCETLWAFGEVDSGDRPVAWSGAVNWVQVVDPAQPCSWQVERWSGVFVPDATGHAVKLDTGEHTLALSAALIDRGGPKALLAEGPGAYATFDLAAGPAKLAHAVTWMLAPNEAWEAVDRLAPPCEHAPAAPAPLPKDAKPVSPY